MSFPRILVSCVATLIIFFDAHVMSQDNPVFHTVKAGETLYAISRKYNISVSDIKSWNGMVSNDISVGERLIVGNQTGSNNLPSTLKEPAAGTSVDQYHTVIAGETLYALSQKYDVAVQDIKAWNNLSSNALQVGQRLVVGKALQTAQSDPATNNASDTQEGSGEYLAYSRAVENGDKALAAAQHDAARSYYETALALMPEMKYPQQKIDEIDAIVNPSSFEATEARVDSIEDALEDQPDKYVLYSEAVEEADSAFARQDYDRAVISYKAALEVLPEMIYPQRKIEEIEELLALEPEPAISMSDSSVAVIVEDTASMEPRAVESGEEPVDNGLMAFTHYAALKSKPSDFGKVVEYLPPDSEVYILGMHSGGRNYYKVQYNDQHGYIHKKNIKKSPEVIDFNESLND